MAEIFPVQRRLRRFASKLEALAAFAPLYRKNSGVFPKKFDPGANL